MQRYSDTKIIMMFLGKVLEARIIDNISGCGRRTIRVSQGTIFVRNFYESEEKKKQQFLFKLAIALYSSFVPDIFFNHFMMMSCPIPHSSSYILKTLIFFMLI